MRKVLILLLLLLVACGGTSEESSVEDTTTTTVEDTTTTTIPPAPTSDTNYIELYYTKLGTELCSDAKEIDTTSEECLRQYKENLNYLITLQNEIGNFGSALIAYYETYPELVNQEYEDYINFIENEYSQVFLKFSDVENKYIERFGGVPIVNEISINDDIWNNCSVNYKVAKSENLKSGYVEYTNSFGDKIILDLVKTEFISNSYGGKFIPSKVLVTNYLDEEFELEINNSIKLINIKHWNPIIKSISTSTDNDSLNIKFEFIDGYKKFEKLWLNFIRKGLYPAELHTTFSRNELLYGNSEIFNSTNNSIYYELDLNRNYYADIEPSQEPFRLSYLEFYSSRQGERSNIIEIEYSGDNIYLNTTNFYGCNGESSVTTFEKNFKNEVNLDNYLKQVLNTQFKINK